MLPTFSESKPRIQIENLSSEFKLETYFPNSYSNLGHCLQIPMQIRIERFFSYLLELDFQASFLTSDSNSNPVFDFLVQGISRKVFTA